VNGTEINIPGLLRDLLEVAASIARGTLQIDPEHVKRNRLAMGAWNKIDGLRGDTAVRMKTDIDAIRREHEARSAELARLRAEVADLRAREKAADDYARKIRNDVAAIRARLVAFEGDLERIAGIDKHPILHISRLLTAIRDAALASEKHRAP
jgi:hypothetical protein